MMQYIQGISRHQLLMSSLEDKITADNLVRSIDALVNHLDTSRFGKGKQDTSQTLHSKKRKLFPFEILSKLLTKNP